MDRAYLVSLTACRGGAGATRALLAPLLLHSGSHVTYRQQEITHLS
jgi:sirohydrochlorin ferrochelatase